MDIVVAADLPPLILPPHAIIMSLPHHAIAIHPLLLAAIPLHVAPIQAVATALPRVHPVDIAVALAEAAVDHAVVAVPEADTDN